MGPKRGDSINKGHRLSNSILLSVEDQENQQCTGKFAADVDFCCRTAYPVNIPVVIRGHPPPSSLISPPFSLLDEQNSGVNKRSSRGRIPSITQNGTLSNIDNDTRSNSLVPIQDTTKPISTGYRTFHLIRDSEYFRPKLSVDFIGNENEPIEQINTLYMRAWQLDQRFLDHLKKILPLQEHLHTLNFCFIGLNEQTLYGLADVCQLIKNLKTLSLDGNPLAANHFHIFLERDDLKLIHLSLRYCKITDGSIERLAYQLGNMSTQNWKLLTLTLTGNQIGDNGAKAFAKALRYNRTLISLNLSSNFITDKGACSLALVLRKIILTQEEIVQRRYLVAERYADAQLDEMRNIAVSPTLSIGSVNRSARDGKRLSDTHKRRKSISKSTDKRHRAESSEDSRPPSASKSEIKKGKNDGASNRSSTVHARRSAADQTRPTTGTARGKKTSSTASSSKKNISAVKEEDEDVIDELIALQIQNLERENPLYEMNELEMSNGEISLKGNLTLLSLNLSRNYLTMTSVDEFLQTIQTQMNFSHFNDASSFSSTTVSATEFSGLSRLELKGMNEILTNSLNYQRLRSLLNQKNPLHRIQQIRERDAKDLFDQPPSQASQPTLVDKPRAAANVKSSNQRPTSRMKD